MRRRRVYIRDSWLYRLSSVLIVVLLILGLGPNNAVDVLAQTEQVAPDQPEHGPVDHIVISPDTATITTGQSQSYAAAAFDTEGNSWDVTADTVFSIDPDAGGSWSGDTYTSESAGTWTVTGNYDSHTDDSILTVEMELQPTTPAPSPETTAVVAYPDQDVELVSPSGKVTLRIPKGAVSTPVEVELAEHAPWGSTGMRIVSLFELNAKLPESGEKVSEFNEGLEISIKHDPDELAGLNIDSLRLYYLNEKSR